LLTSSVKLSFDNVDEDLRSFAIQPIQLDRSLLQYGSAADPARAAAQLHRRGDRFNLDGRAEPARGLLSETS
jgi:hypothetical protein